MVLYFYANICDIFYLSMGIGWDCFGWIVWIIVRDCFGFYVVIVVMVVIVVGGWIGFVGYLPSFFLSI